MFEPITKLIDDEEIIYDQNETEVEENEQQRPINTNRRTRYNLRNNSEKLFSAYEQYVEAFDAEPDPIHTAFALANQQTKNHPVSMYLPEPQSFRAVLDLPNEAKALWMTAIHSELKNLIIDNETFSKENPRPGEQVIPCRIVNKAKSDPHGNLAKLKARIVARGDLQKENDWEDAWSACASTRTVKVFLALATKMKRRVKQADFIGAFLQAKVRGRYFVKLDERFKHYFPDLASWFGRPLRLKRGIYGQKMSGKFWNQDYTEWLLDQGFEQSTADTTYFIKYNPDGSWIRLIFYVDDCLYYGSTDKAEKDFEKEVAKRFKIEFNGNANWFLQMRIHQYADYSCSIDQYRYTKTILKKYCPETAPFGIPPHRATPAPPKYIFSKEHRPTEEEQKQIDVDYEGLHYRSAVCSLLYLALGTRGDILFIVNKLAKACVAPGKEDFKALLWLFGYLRAEPAWGSKFYSDMKESPVNNLVKKHILKTSDIIVFTDGAWQDCPDTGRSTTGFLIYYQGGVIEANSSLQVPVAMSSCEAEVMASCSGCMAAAHIHMLLYDMKYLGTKDYNCTKPALPDPPTIIMVDNQAAVQMSLNDKLTKHTRHISRRFHYVTQGAKKNLHKLEWCPGEDMLADIMTKSTDPSKTSPHRDRAYYSLPKFLHC